MTYTPNLNVDPNALVNHGQSVSASVVSKLMSDLASSSAANEVLSRELKNALARIQELESATESPEES